MLSLRSILTYQPKSSLQLPLSILLIGKYGRWGMRLFCTNWYFQTKWNTHTHTHTHVLFKDKMGSNLNVSVGNKKHSGIIFLTYWNIISIIISWNSTLWNVSISLDFVLLACHLLEHYTHLRPSLTLLLLSRFSCVRLCATP